MKSALKITFALFVLAFIVSCASTSSFETNKNPSFNEPITKLYVIVDVGDHPTQGGKLGEVLATDMQNALQQDGIDSKAVAVTGLELNGDNYKEISDFGANQALVITLTQG
jgi:hypothetical protein